MTLAHIAEFAGSGADGWDTVEGERGITRHDVCVETKRLGDEHPIEWIPVVGIERRGVLAVDAGHG